MAAQIEDIVDVTIEIKDKAVEQANFGVGLILGRSDKLVGAKIQEFTTIDAIAAIFSPTDPELIMATDYFGQDVKPDKVFIADRDADVAEKKKVIITQLANGATYTMTITPEGVAAQVVTFISDVDATRAEIITGLIAAAQAIDVIDDNFTFTNNGDDLDMVEKTPGDPYSLVLSVNLTSQILVALVNISTELVDIEALESGWYALMSDSHTDNDIKRAADFIQPRRKIYIPSSSNADIISSEQHIQTLDFDADFVTANLIDLDIDAIAATQTPFNTDQATTIADLATNIQAHNSVSTATVTGARQITITSVVFDTLMPITNIAVTLGVSQAGSELNTIQDPTTDLGAELKALALDRTGLFFKLNADVEFPEGGWIGGRLPNDPGSQTWFGKSITGVTTDDLTSSQSSKARNNNVNTYELIGGLGFTREGTMASGRFIDIRRSVDFIEARMEEQIFALIASSKKIPYTNDGANLIGAEVSDVLSRETEIIAQDPEPEVNVPDVRTEVAQADRANRLLPDITFSATLAGAIHRARINGTVSV